MEKNRKIQVIAIAALVVGVVGLTIGFAAFSNVLTIKSSANVSPDASSFNVDFSSSSTEVLTDEIVPTVTPDTLVATNATIDNSNSPTISNLKATFTEPGQKAVYTFYAYNKGELDAYLKSIVYANVSGQTSTKICTAGTGTTDELVQKACSGISVKVKVGSESETNSGIASISNHKLVKKTSELVTVTIEYQEGSEVADGDFTVSFGDITLNYSSVD
jgi:hypothetical protein